MGEYMHKEPLVSIITPFLNREMFLEKSIKSVLSQTYKHWELILVDDGSSDESTKIAKHYSSLYQEKIFYLEHKDHQNLGASASRNFGIKRSKGEYIAFLDSDDVYLSNKLEDQVALLNEQPEAGMLYSSTKYWYSWTGMSEDDQKDWVWDNFGAQPYTLIKPPELLNIMLQKRGTVPCLNSLLVRREALESVGGWENSFRNLYDDQVFYTKIFLKWPVFISNGCWDLYRQHSNSMCATMKNPIQKFKARYKYLEWLEEYLTNSESAMNRELLDVVRNVKRDSRYHVLYFAYDKYNDLKKEAKKTLKLNLRKIKSIYFRVKIKYLHIGRAEFGNLRRVTPISRKFGFDRGLPIDRLYIEKFLEKNTNDIFGRVLEVGEATYTQKFGGKKVTKSDVLHIIEGNPEATIIADITNADHIPSHAFDCIILTQTLHLIYDLKSALKTLYRILKPGGVLLVTVPGISQVVRCNWGDNWYWALTNQSAQQLFEELFEKTNIQIETHGNVLAAIAFLHGIAVEELTLEELNYHDDEYQVIITVRAIK